MKPAAPHQKHKPHSRPPQKNVDCIWGIHPVADLLTKNPADIIEIRFLKQKSTKLQELIDQAEQTGTAYHFADKPYPETPEDARHQGVLARIKPVQTISLAGILAARPEGGRAPILLALDSIQDPHNFGSIIRSASAAGVSGILFTKDRSAPLSGTVAKVSVGAINHMPLCPVTNMATTLDQLKEEGFWIFGADGSAETSVYQSDFSGPVCLVIGGEAKGIRPLVKTKCDFLISIPMRSDLDSLNASVATAVILFEIVRRQTA